MENARHPVQRSPAPWTLSAESYLLFLKLKELPRGLYDGLEEAWGDEGLGRFEGGLGAVMIVRYTDTPVGRSISHLFGHSLHLKDLVQVALNFKCLYFQPTFILFVNKCDQFVVSLPCSGTEKYRRIVISRVKAGTFWVTSALYAQCFPTAQIRAPKLWARLSREP